MALARSRQSPPRAGPLPLQFRGRPHPTGWRPLAFGPDAPRGFTLLELLMVMVIIGVLTSLAFPRLERAVEKARIARAIGDINAIEADLLTYEAGNGTLPAGLAVIGRANLLDPWGNTYQYLPIRGYPSTSKGKMRKDRFLVPINSDFDLYSMGPDGKSSSPLTAKISRDDIVRANDGGYVGEASGY